MTVSTLPTTTEMRAVYYAYVTAADEEERGYADTGFDYFAWKHWPALITMREELERAKDTVDFMKRELSEAFTASYEHRTKLESESAAADLAEELRHTKGVVDELDARLDAIGAILTDEKLLSMYDYDLVLDRKEYDALRELLRGKGTS